MAKVICTASGQKRSWPAFEWIEARGMCPDCGRPAVFIRNRTTLSPYGIAVRHNAPEGVTPAPYAHHEPEERQREHEAAENDE